VIKNSFISILFMLHLVNHLSSPNPFFGCENSYKVVLHVHERFLSVGATHLKWDFSAVNWVTECEKIRQMNSTEILLNTATMIELNSTAIVLLFLLKIVWREKHWRQDYYAPLQRRATNKQTNKQTNSHNFNITNWINYSDFHCYLGKFVWVDKSSMEV